MKALSKITLVLCAVITVNIASALAENNTHTFTSGTEKVQLVELYSSQGCSSCPPAQRYLNKLSDSPLLWDKVVPVVFHVDYWDYLGWKDPYSSAEYSSRQRQFKRQGLALSVYTPGFFVQGQEWTGFFKRKQIPLIQDTAPQLKVTFEENKISAFFGDELAKNHETLSLNIAYLGMDLSTHVHSGENRSKTLDENFIVLSHHSIDSTNGNWEAEIQPPSTGENLAIAAWVTRKGELEPLQVTGGPITF